MQSVDINNVDTAWMIVPITIVLLMTASLTFFYNGVVSKKNIISILLQGFITVGVFSLLWILFGFNLAFGDSFNSWGIIRIHFQYAFLNNLETNNSYIPCLLFALFQLIFTIITTSLTAGSFAEKIRFRG